MTSDVNSQEKAELEMLGNEENGSAKESVRRESLSFNDGAFIVFKMSYPLIITAFCTSLSDILIYSLAGRLSTESLGGLGLGLLTSRILSSDVLFSLATGFDTVGSQSFGKGDFKMVGIYLYRALLILNLIGLPTYILLIYSEHILLSVGITPEAAVLGSGYASRMILNTIFVSSFLLCNKFLIVQRIVKPQMFIVIVTASLNPVWVYLFAFVWGLDLYGIPYAYALTNAINLIATLSYILFSGDCRETLPPFDRSVLLDWIPFLKIAIPSGIMLILELMSYLFLNILSGSLSAVSLAANQSLCNLHAFNFSIPVGIGSAACALVGNSLGNQKIRRAKYFITLALIVNTIVIGSYIFVTLIFKRALSSFYSKSSEVQLEFEGSLMLLLFSDTFDTTQAILCRVLIAAARQPFASVVNLIVYFVYMLPLGYALLFPLGMGIRGIWIALGTSYMITTILFANKIVWEDWKKVANEAVERIERDKKNIQ